MNREAIKQKLEEIGRLTTITTGHGESSTCLVFEDNGYENQIEALTRFCESLSGP